jgi:hypothetical protein
VGAPGPAETAEAAAETIRGITGRLELRCMLALSSPALCTVRVEERAGARAFDADRWGAPLTFRGPRLARRAAAAG